MIKPTPDKLKEVRLLATFQTNELEYLIRMGQPVSFESHSNVIIEGELSWGLYLILSGVCGVFKTNKLTHDSFDVAQLREGSFFGEMSLIDDQARSATVKALTECQLFYISKESFQQFLGMAPTMKERFHEAVIRILVGRLRELDDSYVTSQYQLWKTVMKREAS
jgi:CRP/FNR family transcriptional regulator, cyclic AMP receptor protein